MSMMTNRLTREEATLAATLLDLAHLTEPPDRAGKLREVRDALRLLADLGLPITLNP